MKPNYNFCFGMIFELVETIFIPDNFASQYVNLKEKID